MTGKRNPKLPKDSELDSSCGSKNKEGPLILIRSTPLRGDDDNDDDDDHNDDVDDDVDNDDVYIDAYFVFFLQGSIHIFSSMFTIVYCVWI